MKKATPFAWLIMALFALNACKPKRHELLVESFTRSYTDFNEGSYWIYVDSVNGEMDSFTLVERSEILDPDSENSEQNQEDYYQRISTKMRGYEMSVDTVVFSLSCRASGTWGGTMCYLGTGVAKPPYEHADFCRFMTTTDNSNISTDCGPDREIISLGSYELNGQQYNNVYQLNYALKNKDIKDTFLVAAGVGIIGWHHHGVHTHRLHLIRHHIVQ